MIRNRQIIIHPFLFCTYSVLAMYANNITEVQVYDVVRTFVFSLAFTILIICLLRLLFKDWAKAGLVTSLIVILFFTYGHLYNLLRESTIFGLDIFRHRYLGLGWVSIFAIGLWWIIRRLKNTKTLNSALNIIAVVAVVIPLYQVLNFQLRLADQQPRDALVEFQQTQPVGNQPLPDIYYIILDSYTRDDYLREWFDYDNSPFLQALVEKGFFVARCGQSNYSQTTLSLASTLNMNYLKTFYEYEYEDEAGVDVYKKGLASFIKDSLVRQIFENLGYRVIAFESGYDLTEIEDADLYLELEDQPSKLNLLRGVNDFEVMMIRSTGLLFISALSPSLAEMLLPDLDYPHKLHRERVLFVLDTLEELPSVQGPKFVFAYIVSPHKPFVFGPEGELILKEPNYGVGYPDQINYLNKRVEKIVDQILQNSEVPPIIIIQADHGARQDSGKYGRMAILNTHYLPGGGDKLLYDSITPVNTFRIILNYYFGYNYDLLEDISYRSNYGDPAKIHSVPDTREGCD